MLSRKLWFAFVAGALALLGGVHAQEKAKTDVNGDPLPAGALARMGTLRWRHAEAVTFVAYTPDGKTVLTAGLDNVIKLWERASGKEIRRFELKGPANPQPGQPGMIAWNVYGARGPRVALSEDGKVVAAVLPDNAIQLWDVATGKDLRQLKLPQFAVVTTMIFSPDGKVLAGRANNRTTYLVDSENGKVLQEIKPPVVKAAGGGAVFIGGGFGADGGLAFSRDGKTIATTESEFANQKITTYIRLSDVQTGNEIRKIDTANQAASAIAFARDGKSLAFASGNVIHLREPGGVKEISQIKTPIATAAVAFSPDSATLAVRGRDQVIRLLEVNTGKTLQTLGESPLANANVNVAFGNFGGTATPQDFAFSPDGKVLAAAAGPTLRFWTVQTGKEQPLAGGHRGAVSTVAVSADGKTMFSRGTDGTIRRWEAATGNELGQFAEPRGTIAALFSPDGKTAALANQDGSVRLCETADGKELHKLPGHPNGAAGLAFSADSKLLASRGIADKAIRIYDVAKGTERKEITLPGANQPMAGGGFGGGLGGSTGQGLAFSRDGQTIAANVTIQTFNPGGARGQVNFNSTLHFWDVGTGKEIRKITLPEGRSPLTLAYAPDGRLLAAENADQTVSLIELASGKERAVLGTPMAAAPGGGQPFVIINGGIGRFGAAARVASALAFSPDGALLVTRGPEHAVRVWEVDHAKQVGQFKGHAGEVQALAIAPDGKSVASGSADTTLLVWNLASVKREPNVAAVALEAKQVETLWAVLGGDDAVQAGKSRLTLAAGAKDAVPYLKVKIKPAAAFDPTKIAGWVADLDSANFQKRSVATSELEKLGELAVPALQKALASNPTVEKQRRIEPILEKAISGDLNGEQVRVVRAMEVLERAGTPEARQLLETLAQGAPGAFTTRQAEHALRNLAGRAK